MNGETVVMALFGWAGILLILYWVVWCVFNDDGLE